MPVITFLQDLFSLTKGKHYRVFGRHTQRFCSRATLHTRNGLTRKILAIAAVAAEEQVVFYAKEARDVKGKNIPMALRVYLSTLLLASGSQKEGLLAAIGLDEPGFIRLWTKVFEYTAADMGVFDRDLRQAYVEGQGEGLVRKSGELLLAALCPGKKSFGEEEVLQLAENLNKDLRSFARLWQVGGESRVSHR